MATNIDKGLYAAPLGMEELVKQQSPLEIEIENPDAVHIGMGGMEIDLEPKKETAEDFDANLAEYMDENELQSLQERIQRRRE